MPGFLLAMLWVVTAMGVLGCLRIPIEKRRKATVIGTPPDYRAELQEMIPLKKRRIEILDREVPEALWHDQELRYSYALQKDPAICYLCAGGTGEEISFVRPAGE